MHYISYELIHSFMKPNLKQLACVKMGKTVTHSTNPAAIPLPCFEASRGGLFLS